MKKFFVLMLLVLAFRSNLVCQDWWDWDWKWDGEKFIRKAREQKKAIIVSEYLDRKCEVCGKSFNYTIEIDSACKVINDKTETFLGRNMHKDCYEKLITFLIYDYQIRKGEYFSNMFITCSTVALNTVIMSSSVIGEIKLPEQKKKKK